MSHENYSQKKKYAMFMGINKKFLGDDMMTNSRSLTKSNLLGCWSPRITLDRKGVTYF